MNNPSPFVYALLSVSAVSVLSLIGLSLFPLGVRRLKSVIFLLVSLAVGALLGDAFFHLLPEAFEDKEHALRASSLVMGGFFLFFILERLMHWHHHHSEKKGAIHPYGYLNLAADGFHNFIDGLLIGASFLAGMKVGIATSMAVLLHEIPHEMSNFGILVHAGFTRERALFFNFMTAMVAILGTLLAWGWAGQTDHLSQILLPLTAGGFIYIAGSDLVPELQKELRPRAILLQLVLIAFGGGFMLLLKLLD